MIVILLNSQTLRLEKDVERFTANTASATGQSERLVQLNVERGTKVIAEVIDHDHRHQARHRGISRQAQAPFPE
ncbi:hypothetical protein [Rhizobium mesosinicum]|uniref:DUF2188 domain-containing protein n=1 Tax=Rhizobium mesosinicum TaxID=335017 RepID=A0ABS7GV15_9HYPH|nr:hypothetical protein [Rhizobium mesosinicum]MBW9053441.1 hypothetical protein [Rhizobium mesosinicum]